MFGLLIRECPGRKFAIERDFYRADEQRWMVYRPSGGILMIVKEVK